MEDAPLLREHAEMLLVEARKIDASAPLPHEALSHAIATNISVEAAIAQERATEHLATLTT